MSRRARILQPLLLGGWVLMMPPVPLGTSLPPIERWSKVGTFQNAADCNDARELQHKRARHTVTANPNATAYKISAAMGQLQSRCIEVKTATAEAEAPAAAGPEVKAADAPPAK